MAAPDPDSIAGIAARLALWGSRAPKGLARVEFDSDFSRREVDARVRDACAAADLPFYVIELPRNTPAPEVVTYLLEKMAALPHGVVSITGWATAFPNDVPLLDSLRVLNYNRENLAQFNLCQIWWLTRPLTDAVIRNIPDLASWFIVRLSLRENIVSEKDETISSVGFIISPEAQDTVRRQTADIVSRFDIAIERGENAAVLLMLANVAVVTISNADLAEEAHDLAGNLLKRILDHVCAQESYASYSQGSFCRPDTWNKILASQTMEVYNRISELAFLFYASGQVQEAIEFYKFAANMMLANFRSSISFNGILIHQLARLYRDQGNYDDAIALYQHLISVIERSPHRNEIELIDYSSALAGVYRQKGDYAEAEILLHHALRMSNEYAEVFPTAAVMLSDNLAALYRRLGRFAEADMYTARAESLRTQQAKKSK